MLGQKLTMNFFEKLAKTDDNRFFSVLYSYSLPEGIKKVKKEVVKNVTAIETVNPNVIIQPKSIIGLIPLNIKDRKAQTVVSTV